MALDAIYQTLLQRQYQHELFANLTNRRASQNGLETLADCPLCAGSETFRYLHTEPTWHCFRCGKNGDWADYLSTREALPLAAAEESLARMAAGAPPPPRVPLLPVPPRPPSLPTGNSMHTWGLVLGIVGIFLGPLFSITGIVLASLARARHGIKSRAGLTVSIVALTLWACIIGALAILPAPDSEQTAKAPTMPGTVAGNVAPAPAMDSTLSQPAGQPATPPPADIDTPNADGKTPLDEALMANDWDRVRLLVESGANVNTSSFSTPLWQAVSRKNVEIAQLLLDHGADIEAKDSGDPGGLSPLAVAATFHHPEMVRLLLSRGADVHSRAALGDTPLHWAANIGTNSRATDEQYIETAKLLLEAGADVNAADNNRVTPLMMANHPAMVDLLVAHGANANAAGATSTTYP